MQPYTKIYLEAFKLAETDFVPCEICEKKATEIHHILGRQGYLLTEVRNLMAICREDHEEYGQMKTYTALLLKIHRRRMQLAKIPFNDKWFAHYIKFYNSIN